LSYISFATPPVSRKDRVEEVKAVILDDLDKNQKEFLDFVLSKYVDKGVGELAEDKLPKLLNLKYHAIADAEKSLGGVINIRELFFNLQERLYEKVRLRK